MEQFLEAILSPVNFMLTIFMVLLLVYWAIVVFGGLDMDALDIDVDADLDIDVDTDADLDVDGGAGSWLAVLRWIGVGEVPFMVLISVLVLVLWAAGVLLHPLIGEFAIPVQFALLVPMLFGAIILTRILTYPIARFYKSLRDEEEREQKYTVIGQRGIVVSGSVSEKIGQIEVDKSGTAIRVNVCVEEGKEEIEKGKEVIVVRKDSDDDKYIVRIF